MRDTFHALIAGTMKGSRLQDAFFFLDEMKAMGLPPDVSSPTFKFYWLLKVVCGDMRGFANTKRLMFVPVTRDINLWI